MPPRPCRAVQAICERLLRDRHMLVCQVQVTPNEPPLELVLWPALEGGGEGGGQKHVLHVRVLGGWRAHTGGGG